MDRKKLANATITKMKRFRGLRPNIKCHLYKALVRAKLEDPNTLMCIMARTNREGLQRLQNKVLRRFIANRNERNDASRDLHQRYNLEAINVRMRNRAKKSWAALEELNEELTAESIALNNDGRRDHGWWGRIGRYIAENDEEPFHG